MNSLLRNFTRLKIAPAPICQLQQRPLSATATLAKGRYHLIEGFSHAKRQPWRNGCGMDRKGFLAAKRSPDAMRIKEFKADPRLTIGVEETPMFWMLRPMKKDEKDPKTGELIRESQSIATWCNNTYARGMEYPTRQAHIEGPVYRFKHWTAQKSARQKRLQMQYDIHMTRLRALSKNEVLPKEFRRQALEQLWMMNFGRFGRLRRRDREYMVCRLHGRPGGNIKPRWGIKRQPMRLLIDYGEGVCGVHWDFYQRRQREFYTDYLRRHDMKKRNPRSWHRTETYYRYRNTPFNNPTGSVHVNTSETRALHNK